MHETDSAVKDRVGETGGRLYTIREAMAELRLSRATIFRLIGDGRLGSEKHESRRYIPSEAIEEYRNGRVTPALQTSAYVAELLQVDEMWLIGQADANAVPHTRLGDGVVRFTQQQIDNILAAAEVRPSAPLRSA